jgi:hypothetical protein
MAAEWLGLLLTAWLTNPEGVVSQFGHPSYRVREQTTFVTSALGHAQESIHDLWYADPRAWDSVRQVHVGFWKPLTTAARQHRDPEITWRCEQARWRCRLHCGARGALDDQTLPQD